MKLFGPLYERALVWSRNPRAPALLVVLSFAEAVIFPVPPEVMLAPMCLSQPRRGFWFAGLSLAGSLAGAAIGYMLGHYAYDAVRPLLESSAYRCCRFSPAWRSAVASVCSWWPLPFIWGASGRRLPCVATSSQ